MRRGKGQFRSSTFANDEKYAYSWIDPDLFDLYTVIVGLPCSVNGFPMADGRFLKEYVNGYAKGDVRGDSLLNKAYHGHLEGYQFTPALRCRHGATSVRNSISLW